VSVENGIKIGTCGATLFTGNGILGSLSVSV